MMYVKIFIATIVFIWIYCIIMMHRARRTNYECALVLSRQINKPLLVIGDPDKGLACSWLGPQYGTGDVCIDLKPKTAGVIAADMNEYLAKLPSDSHVIYISGVLEYVPDIKTAIREIKRVSGGNLYITRVQWFSPVAYVYSAEGDVAQNIITSYDTCGNIYYFKNPLRNIL